MSKKIQIQTLAIVSTDGLDSVVAEVARLKIQYVACMAAMEESKASIEKSYAAKLGLITDEIFARECSVQAYCTAHRAELFKDKKSRDTLTAVIGFELTPHRVETASRKVPWKDVVKRLMRLKWGKAYVRKPAPQPDKDALLKDRETLKPEQLVAAGIKFEQDEQFFIRPKSPVAEGTVKQAA